MDFHRYFATVPLDFLAYMSYSLSQNMQNFFENRLKAFFLYFSLICGLAPKSTAMIISGRGAVLLDFYPTFGSHDTQNVLENI